MSRRARLTAGLLATVAVVALASVLAIGLARLSWIASHAPKMLALTGRYADGWWPAGAWTTWHEASSSVSAQIGAGALMP